MKVNQVDIDSCFRCRFRHQMMLLLLQMSEMLAGTGLFNHVKLYVFFHATSPTADS